MLCEWHPLLASISATIPLELESRGPSRGRQLPTLPGVPGLPAARGHSRPAIPGAPDGRTDVNTRYQDAPPFNANFHIKRSLRINIKHLIHIYGRLLWHGEMATLRCLHRDGGDLKLLYLLSRVGRQCIEKFILRYRSLRGTKSRVDYNLNFIFPIQWYFLSSVEAWIWKKSYVLNESDEQL